MCATTEVSQGSTAGFEWSLMLLEEPPTTKLRPSVSKLASAVLFSVAFARSIERLMERAAVDSSLRAASATRTDLYTTYSEDVGSRSPRRQACTSIHSTRCPICDQIACAHAGHQLLKHAVLLKHLLLLDHKSRVRCNTTLTDTDTCHGPRPASNTGIAPQARPCTRCARTWDSVVAGATGATSLQPV